MFEENAEIGRMVETLYAACLSLGRGDILTREEIQAVVGVEPNTEHWQHVMNRVRRRVERERSISMMPLRNLGFQLLTVEQQIGLGVYRQRRANRQIRRGERSLKALGNAKGLSLHQKRLRVMTLESLRQSRLKVSEEMRAVAVLRTPTPSLPRPRVATATV